LRLKTVGGWFPLAEFRRQDTRGTNRAYSSPRRMSQEKTAFCWNGGLCQNGPRQ
jgi:hypothetical protein